MSKEKTVWYEPHPVTPERKAELIAEGYKILDIAFKPEGEHGSQAEEPEDDQKATEPKKRGRKPNAEKQERADE